MLLSAAKFMTSFASRNIPKEAEITVKEWAEHYRPVRQRSVGSETTKDKADALPPVLCSLFEVSDSLTKIYYSPQVMSCLFTFSPLVVKFLAKKQSLVWTHKL